jgi:hypothetical protein
MTQVTLSPDALALLAHYEVQKNIADEAKRERELYERGVKAMRDAQGIEASDYAVNSITFPNGTKWYNS